MRILTALALAMAPGRAQAAIHCVRPGGGAPCHPTILAALALAVDGDTIRVAAGTYPGSLLITKNVTLEGGWNASFTSRDPLNPATIIVPSAFDSGSVIAIVDSSFVLIDGLLVTGGRGSLTQTQGGGIRVIRSSGVLRNLTVLANSAFVQGGGIWVQRSTITVEDSKIEGNAVTSGPQRLGGGISIESGSATLTRCVVSGNSTDSVSSLGGGIAILNFAFERDQFLRVTDSVIENNSAGEGGYGGGIAAQILDTPAAGTAGVFLERVRLVGNEASVGSALSLEEAPFQIAGSLIAGNVGEAAIVATDFSASASLSPGKIWSSTLVGDASASGIETDAPLEVVNSILVDHAFGIAYAGPASGLVLRNSAFFGNGRDVSAGAGFALDASNLRVDPRLDASLRLLPDSALIDAGARVPGPFADLDGEPRPAVGHSGRFAFDIGADEAPGEAQRVFEIARGAFDLALVGPGAERPGPPSASSAESIGSALLGSDWSGDGIDDLLVLARGWGRGLGVLGLGTRALGAIDLWLGPAPDLELVADPPQDLRSRAAGRLRGVGSRDVALGSGAGVFALRAGPALAGTLDLGAASALRVLPPAPSAAFAHRGALAIGDLSGDGIDDLVIGDAQADDGSIADAGAVFAVFGSPALSGVRDLAASSADWTIRGATAASGLGSALALADLDGDGDLDLAIGDAARTHIVFGPLSPGVRRLSTAPADVRIENLAGTRLAAMDLTGEGRTDLIGGAGPLRVMAGPFRSGQLLDASSAAHLTLTSPSAPQSLHAADVLGDARAELLIGLAGEAFAISSGVRATGTAALDELASAALFDATPSSQLGADLAAADLDADGRSDWLATDPAAAPLAPHPPGAEDAGRVYAFYGGLAADVCPGLSDPEQLDRDGDGAGDACDVCPFSADPTQRDLGAAASPGDPQGATSDGIGDACQCGDATGDGRANAADLGAIRRALSGAGAPAAPQRCNVRGPNASTPDPRTGLRQDCSLVDAVALARRLAGQPPGIAQVCEPASAAP